MPVATSVVPTETENRVQPPMPREALKAGEAVIGRYLEAQHPGRKVSFMQKATAKA